MNQDQTQNPLVALAVKVGELSGKMDILLLTITNTSQELSAVDVRLRELETARSKALGYVAGVGAVGGLIGTCIAFLAHTFFNK